MVYLEELSPQGLKSVIEEGGPVISIYESHHGVLTELRAIMQTWNTALNGRAGFTSCQ
jgi:hypothetical protein